MNQMFFGNARIMLFNPGSSPAPGPVGHPETRFTLQDETIETHDITGTIDQKWMIDNRYWDESNWEWTKTITQANIGNTVTSIGTHAFYYCNSIASITIPSSVTSIEQYAFYNCLSLASITIPSSVASIGDYAFSYSELTNVTVGNGVTSIGESAFESCSSLTSVTIPDSVTSIWERAFQGCSSLTTVTIVANGGNAASVKENMIIAGVSESITWNMPS